MASTAEQRARLLLCMNIGVLVVLGPYALLAPGSAAAHLFGDSRAGKQAALMDMSPPTGGSPLYSYQMLGACGHTLSNAGSCLGIRIMRLEVRTPAAAAQAGYATPTQINGAALLPHSATMRFHVIPALHCRDLVAGRGRGLGAGPQQPTQVQVMSAAMLCCAALRCSPPARPQPICRVAWTACRC